MKTVFADTGYWIALVNPSDTLHDKAINLTTAIMPAKIVTTEMIFAEFLNAFSRRGEQLRKAGDNLIDSVLQDPTVEVMPQTTQLFEAALKLYSQRLDQAWSHNDCASFCVMRERDITEALAYDRHFEQAGFIPLLRDC